MQLCACCVLCSSVLCCASDVLMKWHEGDVWEVRCAVLCHVSC